MIFQNFSYNYAITSNTNIWSRIKLDPKIKFVVIILKKGMRLNR